MAWFPLHLRNQSSLWKVRKILLLPISRVCLICMLLLCWKGGRHYLPGREDGILSSSDVWTSIRDGASKREENFPLFIVHNKPLCLKCIVVVLRESASEVSFCLLTTFCLFPQTPCHPWFHHREVCFRERWWIKFTEGRGLVRKYVFEFNCSFLHPWELSVDQLKGKKKQ